jgi:hypothetical protein
MAVYSVERDWGHAMLVRSTGETLEPQWGTGFEQIGIFHEAPPLRAHDFHPLSAFSYLAVFDAPSVEQDAVLKDVCAAMVLLEAFAEQVPDSGLLESPGCYSIVPSGILTSINVVVDPRTTSCCGLVEECYRYAGVTLVEEHSIPEMGFNEIKGYIGRIDQRYAGASDAAVRRMLGIKTTIDPMKPLFPSYQMLAFETNDYPYQVQNEDPKTVIRWR